MKRPKCRNCGKPLRKHTRMIDVPVGDPVPTSVEARDVLQVTRDIRTCLRRMRAVYVWLGDWGGYGDNRFCGLNCGYHYALRVTATRKVH